MRSATRLSLAPCLALLSVVIAACSGVSQSSGTGGTGSGPGSGSGSFTIGGTVTGLAGTGLILQDNSGDNLPILANGAFTFKTSLASGKAYSVTVFTQPSNPTQTCIVAGGSGTATANVTSVQVTCSTGTVSIGGNVTGLSGAGLVLQNNGSDNLTISQNGSFTFKTALTIGASYSVTIFTQPTSPAQTCVVSSGSGTASANVGNISVTCSTGTLSVGGTVSGLAGTGLILQDNGGDNLTIAANGAFVFKTLIPGGGAYSVTVLTQPSGPAQTCTVNNGSGTANANVANVQVVCPAVFHTIGGTVVGLQGTNTGMVLQDNGGDNLPTGANGAFTFVTQIANGSSYDVSIFVGPNSQPGIGCVVWNYQGTAITDVTNVTVDCGHNDWTWMDGSNQGNQKGSFTALPSPLPNPLAQNSSTPGGRRYGATWTDLNGNLWFFGGYGYTYDTSVPLQPTYMNDLWVYTGTKTPPNYFGGYYNIWQVVKPSGSVPIARWGAVSWTDAAGDLWLYGGQDAFSNFLNDLWKYNIAGNAWTLVGGSVTPNQAGVYGTEGTPSTTNFPGGRWGSVARIDATGKVWLFGGEGYDSAGTLGLLNDLWTYNSSTNAWTWVSGADTANATGTYGTQGTASASNVPGGRQASVGWVDNSNNFWLFGGFDLDSTGHPDALNDLWEFSGGQWTWVAGSNVVNQTGVYGTQGVAASTNVPGARWSPAAWTDASGNLWLFGGQGFDSTGNGSLADLWEFKGGDWIWVKGPSSVSQAGIYGIAPNPVVWPYVVNNPGSRYAPGYWIDKSNQFWMFGGEGFDSTSTNGNGLLNDLWRYLPYP